MEKPNVEWESQEEISKQWIDGDFEAKLKLEIKTQDHDRPFIIFKQLSNPPKKGQRTDKPLERPFVFHLDSVSGVVDVIRRYEIKGYKIVYSNIPFSKDSETEDRLQPVRDHCNLQAKLREEVRAQIMAEYGIEDKLKKKLEAKGKSDAN